MALSNRSTTPIPLFKHPNLNPEPDRIDADQPTMPLKALVRLEPAPAGQTETLQEPAYLSDTAEVPTVNPLISDVTTDVNTSVNPNPEILPATLLPEIPLYMRNPGPPPRLPHNRAVKSLGRTSYRFQQVQFGYANHRKLLYICAAIGIILLFVLVVIRPQDRKVEISSANAATSSATEPTSTKKPVYTLVSVTEQYAIVTDVAGFVLEEPRDGSIQVQNLNQFTLVGLQRKSDDGWFQLKGGTGWIKAASVKIFPTEQAAWTFKNAEEAKIKG